MTRQLAETYEAVRRAGLAFARALARRPPSFKPLPGRRSSAASVSSTSAMAVKASPPKFARAPATWSLRNSLVCLAASWVGCRRAVPEAAHYPRHGSQAAFGPTSGYNADMSKTYIPGDDADAIIARQVAKGNFPSAEAVVRAGVRMIEEYESDLVRLQGKIDAADAAYRRGEYRKSSDADAMKSDIVSRGEERSRRRT